ncbi:vWA domain-containing protein [Lignipirellula cremea]|uniref:VWFA domain-containing protein n=1 Tax=Lignipirellula cremea TaxID=2528010 RepID=A0A518DM03_9BACT|nr:vWA domain-containing protein [Lignipirellula cremea]QDU92852.1 hypothetical protein Pla8534_06250 [Lignipirellula cremea]
MSPLSLAVGIGLAVALLTAVAEYWHRLRWRPMSRLLFGPRGRPRRWTDAAPVLRVAACGLLGWGLAYLALAEPELLEATGSSETQETDPQDVQRVMLVLDISPSMNVADSGLKQSMRRRDRVYEVIEGVLSRIALTRTRFSVVVFFTSARPVVVDATDTALVRNVLDNLPLVWSFKPGETDLVSGLETAGELAKDWPPQSTTLFLCTDGDTVDFNELPQLPRSIRKLEILAVGDPMIGTFVGNHDSRQQSGVLKRLAAELGGTYHNVNQQHMATSALADLARVPPPLPGKGLQLKDLARIAVGLGAAILALLPLALQYGGSSWKPHRELPARSPRTADLATGENG